jgi:hypothetical protein
VDPISDFSENLAMREIEPGTSGSVARNSGHRGGRYRSLADWCHEVCLFVYIYLYIYVYIYTYIHCDMRAERPK